jgi:hypothetical protein
MMAKVIEGVAWYHHPRYRAKDEKELARNIYGADGAEAEARRRRAMFDRDVRYLNHVLRTGDVPEDAPAPARRQTTDAAFALWGRQQQAEANEAARQELAQRLYEQNMKHWGFTRKT